MTTSERQDVTAHAPSRPEFDWRINIPSLGGLFAAVLAGGLWLGGLQGHISKNADDITENAARIAAIEKSGQAIQREVGDLRTAIAVVQTLVSSQNDTLRRIESNLESIMRASRAAGGGD